MSEHQDRRLEILEERLNKAESTLAALSSNVNSISTDLSRRIIDIKENLKEDLEKIRVDLLERINDLKNDIKDDLGDVTNAIDKLTSNIAAVSESLQNLYITQSGSNTKIKVNEKIIWGILFVLVSGALYMFQDLIKVAV